MNNLTNNFQAFEPGGEVKAFIYQQVQDLENLVKDIGSLAVYLEKENGIGEDSYEKFAVTFVIAPESLNLEVRSESGDVFEACRAAKEEAQKKLNSLINAFTAEPDASTPYKGWLH